MKMDSSRRISGFTLIELLVVITIMAILAGLIVSGAGYANREGARSRARAEIAALSTALESYKADNGIYPVSTGISFAPGASGGYSPNPSGYGAASLILYRALSGDQDANRSWSAAEKANRTYFEFRDNMLTPATGTVTAIVDPFGFSYGYSTIYNDGATRGALGYNPTFDLWSTSGKTGGTEADRANWITNW